jgi:ABC-type nickel/cobalt efflux system permease component RcnA
MKPFVRRLVVFFGVAAAVVAAPAAAAAHPLGNFTVNVYAGIRVMPAEVRIDYVLDMAEIPTVQVRPEIDTDGDGGISDAERSAWSARTASELVSNLTLTIDRATVPLDVVSASLRLRPGQGGLDVLRLDATFAGPAPSQGRLVFADANFEDRIGWREITATGADGTAIEGSTVPAGSVTNELRSYPNDLLSSPMDLRAASLSFHPGASAPIAAGSAGRAAEGSRPGVAGGAFAALVERTGPFMVVALLVAFGFGALHALGPGHGKTLMAAYLVGAGGRARHAVAVGGSVAVMHTASVLALGFMVMALTEVFAPERVYPWLGVASGLIAMFLGAGLLVSRLGAWSGRLPDRAHEHEHAHPHEHVHPHDAAAPPLSGGGLAALAVAGGILPSPTALVVLLASVALDRVAYGLALIGAFSLGLATALVVVGIVALRARDAVASRMAGRMARLLPVASASAIAIVGLGLTVRGFAQL